MSGPSTAPFIRYATEQDVPAILSLIRELADYEHALEQVYATESSLLNTLSFPPYPNTKGYARTFLIFHAEDDRQPQGMALFFPNYSTWRSRPGIYLEDLFVRPSSRGKGYGKALLSRLAREVLEMGGERLDWAVLKWNEPSLRFYESEGVGAERLEEWVGMRVEGHARLEHLASAGRERSGDGNGKRA